MPREAWDRARNGGCHGEDDVWRRFGRLLLFLGTAVARIFEGLSSVGLFGKVKGQSQIHCILFTYMRHTPARTARACRPAAASAGGAEGGIGMRRGGAARSCLLVVLHTLARVECRNADACTYIYRVVMYVRMAVRAAAAAAAAALIHNAWADALGSVGVAVAVWLRCGGGGSVGAVGADAY